MTTAVISGRDGKSIRFPVLLDSGADSCVFPLSVAATIGLDVLRLPRAFTSGVGSQSNTTLYETVTIDLGGGLVFDAYAGFTAGLEMLGFGLLGQNGFFAAHNVEFRLAEKVFTIERAEELS